MNNSNSTPEKKLKLNDNLHVIFLVLFMLQEHADEHSLGHQNIQRTLAIT